MPNTITTKAKRLALYQAKIAALQEQVEKDRSRALARLHEEYGFATSGELIQAIRAATGGRNGHAASPAKGHRKYARISAALKEKIKADLRAGKTGGAVASKYGVSVPTVYLIKKAFGLVKSRKAPKSAKPKKARKAPKAVNPAPAE